MRGACSTNVFFTRNSNSMETSPCHNSVARHQIATNFCTNHDSTAVVPCTKFCSDHYIRIKVSVKRNFHRIWIAMEKPLMKRAPGLWRIENDTICHIVIIGTELKVLLQEGSFCSVPFMEKINHSYLFSVYIYVLISVYDNWFCWFIVFEKNFLLWYIIMRLV